MSIRVIVADDLNVLRAGVCDVLAGDPGIAVVGEAENGEQAVRLVEALAPDVAIVDVAMPEMTGIEVTGRLRSLGSATRVVGLSMHTDEGYVRGMLQAGARGYVLKDCAAEELIAAVRAVHDGAFYVSRELPAYLSHDWR